MAHHIHEGTESGKKVGRRKMAETTGGGAGAVRVRVNEERVDPVSVLLNSKPPKISEKELQERKERYNSAERNYRAFRWPKRAPSGAR